MKQEKNWIDCNIINLSTGDLVRHKSGGELYVVTANYGSRATAVCTADITNESEWEHLPFNHSIKKK